MQKSRKWAALAGTLCASKLARYTLKMQAKSGPTEGLRRHAATRSLLRPTSLVRKSLTSERLASEKLRRYAACSSKACARAGSSADASTRPAVPGAAWDRAAVRASQRRRWQRAPSRARPRRSCACRAHRAARAPPATT